MNVKPKLGELLGHTTHYENLIHDKEFWQE